ncbi:MAG: MFS transporter [Salinisphaera sp.]|nr:MFS transporter [Salinisphaera sp.]
MTNDESVDRASAGLEVPKSILHRAITASAMGNAVEWFDYGVYAYLTIHISQALFPAGTNGILWVLAGFAVSFLMRPLGGLFWGPLGDRIGRKRVLAMTIILMASSTVAVGLIPSYATIGIWAPIILYALRIIQGFSAGGEYGGAATFMAEYAPPKHRGFYGSFLEVGTLAGFTAAAVIALGLTLLLGDEAMASWGWRLPFFVALPLGYIGMYLRDKMEDSPVFLELEQDLEQGQEKPPGVYRNLVTKYLRPLLVLMGLVTALNVVDYIFLAYTPTYLRDTLQMSESTALMVPIIGMIIMACLLPAFGHLSDRVGRRPMWMFSCLSLLILVVPLYHAMATGLFAAMVCYAILGLLLAPQLATISATFPAMFPTMVRFAGVAIGYNVATSLFGGTAPAFAEYLISQTGDSLMPAYVMMGSCVIGFVAACFLLETRGVSIRGTQIPGTRESLAEQRQMAAPG